MAASRLVLKLKHKSQTLREVVEEAGLSGAAKWVITYEVPRMFLGAHWTEFAPGVCLGSQHTRWGRCVLGLRGFRAAVNMREDFDDIARGLGFRYHLQPCLQTHDLVEIVRLGLGFIHHHRSCGEKVYIHCSTGVHRGAALAIAYLVSLGWSLAQAKDHLTRCRWRVSIWPSREEAVMEAVEIFLAERRDGIVEDTPKWANP